MKVDIIAGWLIPEEKIGELGINHSHGREIMSVEYDNDWLQSHNMLELDPALYAFKGKQYAPADKNTFGFLSDLSPDRWGRRLIEREERLKAEKESRPIRTLNESDYLLGISDKLRYGAIRFKSQSSGCYLSSIGDEVPPITDIRTIEAAARGYELSSDDTSTLHLLIGPGSSLGGARPKANIIDRDGRLWIAKFPSKNDTYDVGAWEMTEHDLAEKCGLNVPAARLLKLSDYGSTFLSERFDRTENGGRRHLMSFMTALGMTDGHTEGIGYIDIAGQLETMSAAPEVDLKELWKRIAFNILTTDHDDHLRNHGMILWGNEWRLSPAYDLNPVPDQDSLSLNITDNDNRKNINNALDICEFFRFKKSEAKEIIENMQSVIKDNLQSTARKYGISERECRFMEPAFSECHHDVR
jgi:serine/threonine-protein kinase HipA